MTDFNQIQDEMNIQKLIKETFDTDLPLSVGWGYTQEKATVIESLPEGMTVPQLQHMITSIRTHLEMNITQAQANRYGAINPGEKSREAFKSANTLFEKITYVVTAMKEDTYNAFIKEYKAGYEQESFDIADHFKRREEATLTREIDYYFDVTAL